MAGSGNNDTNVSRGHIEEVGRTLIGRPAPPAHLDEADIDAIPEAPCGAYLFYGENELPLYFDMSTQLRARLH